jgi:peptide deformylase
MKLTVENIEHLQICLYPHPILSKVAKPIEVITPEVIALANKMIDLMHTASGIGLAAPQVGVSLRLFVMNPGGEAGEDIILINPKLDNFEGQSEIEEGCLSIPGVHCEIQRSATCMVRAQDLTGIFFEFNCEALISHVVQHENDHLDGVLIIDKLSTLQKMKYRKVIKELERDF